MNEDTKTVSDMPNSIQNVDNSRLPFTNCAETTESNDDVCINNIGAGTNAAITPSEATVDVGILGSSETG